MTLEIATYKPTPDTEADADQIANGLQAVEDFVNGLETTIASLAATVAGLSPSSPTLVAALPVAPANGQEVVFTDSLAAPTYYWHLRYNSTTGKWHYVGGTAKRSAADGNAGSAAASGDWGAALAMAVTAPLAGDYDIRFGGEPQGNGSATFSHLGAGIGAAPAANDETKAAYTTVGGLMVVRRKTGLAAAASIDLYVKDDDDTRRIDFARRWLEIVPVKVG